MTINTMPVAQNDCLLYSQRDNDKNILFFHTGETIGNEVRTKWFLKGQLQSDHPLP